MGTAGDSLKPTMDYIINLALEIYVPNAISLIYYS
jgi:hypothetical protein